MEVASVALSRPVLVNAPLIESSTKSNKEVVVKNRELCNELLQNILPLVPPIVRKEKSIDYLKDWPQYTEIVRFHVDIPIIKTKLEKGLYYCVQDVVDDIELLWSNCINYFATNNSEYQSYLKQQDETRHYIEEMAKSISVFQPIEKDHCIFCGATEYKKYPLVECQGKCGRKSHLHCGQITDNTWTCAWCSRKGK
ncbi:hypothetical protein JH06_4434 [Blastocystis sp. subtype 4]|uniref:hypothetical protein n=1 Tax=Blastocystis sp. subtype 4 TaxID=944170 RepID=UPI0007117CAD|nr:hypothetical protein JH06_4434 [Blastocystis sp. subtype 4]KNB42055.1 hypothetical protein JH06_4434 [Blastocystis sp. subtype 4]|eukprot:XP_014525498.1 hypothetical protein JH06_4434 [Blastocystis sp. subtype 4]